MKLRNALVLLLAALLLTACGGKDTGGESQPAASGLGKADQTAADEVGNVTEDKKEDTKEEEKTPAREKIAMSDKLEDFTVSLNGVVYQFPCEVQVFLDDGWSPKAESVQNGVLTKDAGLIHINAAYYYIDANGAAVTDTEMLVVKTNDLLPEGTYRFGEDGKAILTTELVNEDCFPARSG